MGISIPRTSSRSLDSIIFAVCLLLVYFVGLIIYNIFLHPLRSIPGPPLAKISKAWSRYGNLKGRKSHRIHAAHLRYGPVVRVAPNELSFSSPSAVRDIYSNDAFVKEEAFYRAKRVFHEEMLMSFEIPKLTNSGRNCCREDSARPQWYRLNQVLMARFKLCWINGQ